MAKRRLKPLVLNYQQQESSFAMVKVDRSKLYGYKELEVIDDRGRVCELATLAADGKTVIGKGGTGIGQLTADGQWCDKSELTPVDLAGKAIQPASSSFSSPVELTDEITTEEFLSHNVRLCYLLEAEQMGAKLMDKLTAGSIFKFPYSYRGGLEADAGLLLTNDSGQVFFLVGDPVKIDFIGLQQTAAMMPADDDTDVDADDGLMDFGMI